MTGDSSQTTYDNILIDPNPDAVLDWMVFKLRATTDSFYLYYNEALVYQHLRKATIPIHPALPNFDIGFLGKNGIVDWFRVGDANDNEKYFEDFTDPSRPATADPSFLYCGAGQTDCQLAFATYFNQQRGSSYTYLQIDSLYIQNCGRHPDACAPQPQDSISQMTAPVLCGRNEPVFPPVSVNDIDNCSDSSFFAISKGTELYNAYADSLRNNFDSGYHAKCLQAYKYESFTVTRPVSEYHYTLYYYDQAGSLLKTVPPEGVDMSVYGRSTYFDSVSTARSAGLLVTPQHGLATHYRYNTLNQVIAQATPDAGLSHFWYDRLGRLAISQNARQKAAGATEEDRQYSYTTYDWLGRINEVGQLINTTANGAMTDTVSRNTASLDGWLQNLINRKEQVTRTYYDLAYPYTNTIPLNARNLRNRVAYTTLTDGYSSTGYNTGSFYSYDIHGNVDTLLQDFGSSTQLTTANIMNRNSNRWIRMVYRYDLISGKVNQVAYNPRYYDITVQDWITPPNQFYHRYSYDAENRLTTVETSSDSIIWEKDARYEYYKHGPLARMVIGEQQVQGLDYAYTLQGWLKGVNSTSASTTADMGEDGRSGGQNINVARDLAGYNLNYYSGDYAAIHGSSPFPNPSPQLGTLSGYRPLYNGNISSMAVNIKPFNQPFLYNYKYDQLNRLTGMDTYAGLDTINNNWNALSFTKAYNERVSYDGNGNILKYNRYFDNQTTIMDSLTYHYTANTNKLSSVTDQSQGLVNGAKKIKNQSTDNYEYDEIGNLIKDNSENIPSGGIKWNVYGKITEINHSQAGVLTNTKKINYYYDAAGNRIGKKLTKFGTANVNYTWYVRDAQGNTMHVYTASVDSTEADDTDEEKLARLSSASLLLTESHIYGSSRLGILNKRDTAEPVSPAGS
ncbi:MAG TPA: hypothetical protein VK645_13545, partial [Chitinophagaceae bacterium]|nr:hypothetical protein [Chitinophagaceae bacterium]